MAVKNKRVRIYKFADVGTDGHSVPTHALDPGNLSDSGFWAAVSYVTGVRKLAGAQDESVVTYDVTLSNTAPLTNGDDALIVVLPDETPILKVLSVGELYNTGEKQARCLDVSDAKYTLTD